MDHSTLALPPPIRADLLGPVRLSVGDRPLPPSAWPRRAPRSLFLLLLITRGHSLARDQVLDLLWPDAPVDTSLNALYVALHGLRRVLEPDLRSGRTSAYIDLADNVLRLRPEAMGRVDVSEFEAALAAARKPVADRPDPLQEAIALYGGDLLADEPYLDWAVARREHLRTVWRGAVLDYAERERTGGRPLLALPALGRLLESDPTDEPAHRALMLAMAAAGRREDALRQFDRCARALREELDAEPSDETRALVDDLNRRPTTPPSSRAPSPRFDSLPGTPNPLVGRDREVEALEDLLLRRDVRLVTVTGPGGVGKSRLAIEAAAQSADEFADGVCFVPLAVVTDPRLVIPTIARAVGVSDTGDRPVAELVGEALREREALLVLDNLEQVLDAATDIADLLLACRRLTVLATSREPLHVRAEHEFALGPLATPEPSRHPSAGGVARFAAVELFVQRATAVRADFALTDANAPAVAALCARLDGLPLAIELASARCRTQTIESLVAGLTDRFALLTDGYRDLPPRQRTMRATIAWSYDLLSEREQALYRHLSVFVGGFSQEAAAAVAATGTASPASPLPADTRAFVDSLRALTEKALLRVTDDAGEPRYAMLETTREFGLVALERHGEVGRVRDAHAHWCLALAERAEPELTGAAQAAWGDRLDVEYANLRAALEWLLDRPDPTPALRLAASLWRFWWTRGLAREGREWLERAMALSAAADPGIRAKVLHAAAELVESLGDYRRAEDLYAESFDLSRATENAAGEIAALNGLGQAARALGALDRAQALHEQALQIAREHGNARTTATTLNNLGSVAYFRGDGAGAEARWEEGLKYLRGIGDQRAIGSIVGNLGALALMRGDIARATTLDEEALLIARGLDDVPAITHGLINLAGALFEAKDYGRSRVLFEDALARSRQSGEAYTEAVALYNIARIAEVDGDPPTAAEQFVESLTLFWRTGGLPGLAACLERLGPIAVAAGSGRQAVRLLAAASTIRDTTGASRDTVDSGEYECGLDAARAAVGPAVFDATWAEGAALETADVVEEASAFAAALRSVPLAEQTAVSD
ncbi:MAG: hypothetical protein AVDCRST_MAG49-1446 [uncultured Thermomicrobiales bacterium]|uniref:Bacterial transcriptional activator domain-containing protein n=1 Tax=uncultured Thermomicrobiales bacterium TaxID=1645740 RepID=A0A6J4UD21_9BACT|nr:MAG: hypothetical protein AVDCRST_MAG49-1446 [uncultured Thermomicrobiales bacterium]